MSIFLGKYLQNDLIVGVGDGTTMELAPGSDPDVGVQFANSQFHELALRTESRMSIIDESAFYTGSTHVTDSHAKNCTPLCKIILKQIDSENHLNTRCTYMVQYS